MINKLFNLIKKIYPNINEKEKHVDNRVKVIKSDIIPYDFLLSNYDGDFVFSKITKYIKKCKKYMKLIFKNIILHIFYINENEINIKKLFKTIYRAYTLVKINNNTNNIFNIYILMSPYKRYICKKCIIKPLHINGGFTFVNNNDKIKNIFISRKEEYPKVILHEIIHHFNDINKNYWELNNIKKLKKHFKISNKTILNPNEAIIELWATIYSILFISYEYKVPYKFLLSKEINYSLKQSYKIKLLQNNKEWHEKSNAYCYIIFKTILLYNFNKLMKIYTFPYDTNIISEFLIKNSELPFKNIKNIEYYHRKKNTLCMMLFSDY